MNRSPSVILRRIVTPLTLALAFAACTETASSGPDAERLAGVYSISDWLYVFATDTFDITDDSYLRLEFIDDEHVRGEGYLWINVPVRNSAGELVDDPQPVLWRPSNEGPQPVVFEGWYYVTKSRSGDDILRFRFSREAGEGTLVENLTWRLSEDWRSYSFDATNFTGRLRIVQSVR